MKSNNFKELGSGENYYITSFKKTVLGQLKYMWGTWFVLLMVPNKVWFSMVCLQMMILSSVILYIRYSPVWPRLGYKILTFWLLNIFVFLADFALSRLLWTVLYELILWKL